MPLPIIDLYAQPFEIWNEREATYEEKLAALNAHLKFRTSLKASIANPIDAGRYIAMETTDLSFRRFVNEALDNSGAYKLWRNAMPSATPSAISKYQKHYPRYDATAVSQEIDNIGQTLTQGQCLFHGGLWPGGTSITTSRPFSTSFCPDVALREAEHLSKAYDAGRVDLMIVQAVQPTTKVFCFRNKGSNLGHENEVLFAAGANLTLRSSELIRNDYEVYKYNHPAKEIPIYLMLVEIE